MTMTSMSKIKKEDCTDFPKKKTIAFICTAKQEPISSNECNIYPIFHS